ncbi:MAG TPA: glycosyltransferase [Mycobacteriales bacterium]|jgi:cellulose synthase/poly-beta-1,6-N-acetylglucosamine synthase-like glycosyltransferase|nr:glycosyltransferase [Mycobacteriales bacterium]
MASDTRLAGRGLAGAGRGKIGVVIPVRDGAAVLADGLTGVVAQARDLGAEVVVVDDASTDGTADVAREAGATVLALGSPSGPYIARNAGWRSLSSDVVVFTDARCRPQAGWLAAIVAPFGDPEVAVAGGDIVTLSGPTTAMQWAAEQQSMRIAVHLEDAYYLPAATTANMAVRRSVLAQVDGFAAIRSGGDIDICWRVQERGLGKVVAADGARMEMVPRESTRDVLRQWRRFGYGHLEMHLRHPQRGELQPPVSPMTLSAATARGVAGVVFRPRGSRRVRALDVARSVAYHRAYARAWREWERAGSPTYQSIDDAASPNTAAT